MSTFYYHLAGFHTHDQYLQEFELSPTEYREVLSLLEQAIHYAVADLILTTLPGEQHVQFFREFQREPYNLDHLRVLRQYHPRIDERITVVADHARQRFLDAIQPPSGMV